MLRSTRALAISLAVAVSGAACSQTIDAQQPVDSAGPPVIGVSNDGRNGEFLGAEGSRVEATGVSIWRQRSTGSTRSAVFEVRSRGGEQIGSFSLCVPYDACSGNDTELADLGCREDQYGEIECRVTAHSGIEYQVKRFSPEITVDEATMSAMLWETLDPEGATGLNAGD